jgi:hypothetical protein
VAAIVTVTNPASSGYWVYLACIAGLCRVMDEVVVIDGGTDDGSLELLRDWVGADAARLRVVAGDAVHWGRGGAFHLHQINVSYDRVMRELEHEWVFAMPADQVPWAWDAAALRRMLAANRQATWASFYRSKVNNGVQLRRMDTRGIAVNWARCRERGLPLCWGDSPDGRAGDFPIRALRKSTYLDPSNRSLRTIHAGTEVPPDAVLDLECGTYGHFFLDAGQALAKCRRWDDVASRYYGRAPVAEAEIRLRQGLRPAERHLSREQVMAWEYPPEMRRVVAERYRVGMLGGAVARTGRLDGALRLAYAAARAARSRLLRARGYPTLRDEHAWAALEEPDPPPVDVAEVYRRQDALLGTASAGTRHGARP